MNTYHTKIVLFRVAIVAWFLLCVAVGLSWGQSNDVEYPTPLRESTIEGQIVARDLGDARLTRHYYVFTGTPGDILLRVESANLEGDLDIFRATGLQPLLKVGLYSSGGSSVLNKGAYLKRRETLILRVEARTPDDQPGSYKITFSGSFEVYGGPEVTPPPMVADSGNQSKPKVRVNSVGARLDPEIAQPQPTPKPKETIAANRPPAAKTTGRNRPPQTKPAPTPKPNETPPGPTEIAKTVPPPPKPGSKPNTTRTKPATPSPTPVPVEPEASTKPPIPARTQPKGTAKPRAVKVPPPAKPPRPKPPVIQTLLLLELKVGSRVVRENIKRVTIDNGSIVVVTAEGKLERYSLLNVSKMSVEPSIISPPEEN